MSDESRLAAGFEQEMYYLYEEAKRHGYNATYFLRMLRELRGVETAKRLLASPQMNSGLVRLFELDLLELSVEHVVLDARFQTLFSADERRVARERLAALKA